MSQMSDLHKSGKRYSRGVSRQILKWSFSSKCREVLLSRRRQPIFFCCPGNRENHFGSVGQQNIIIILSFRVGRSKNKKIDYRVKKTCVFMPAQVTYETDHSSLLVF